MIEAGGDGFIRRLLENAPFSPRNRLKELILAESGLEELFHAFGEGLT